MLKAVVVDRDYGSVSIENLEQVIKKQFKKAAIQLDLIHCLGEDEIIQQCHDADAILCIGNPPITRKVIEALPQLKLVQRFGIGVNSVDLNAATEHNVPVLFMPGFCISELAVHATGLILSLLRNITYYDRGIRLGEWRKAGGPVPQDPKNLTLGLYGFGGSAQALYKIFHHGFGTRVISHDPYFASQKQEGWQVEFVSFAELLQQSDIISIHAPLTDETRHIFNRETFKQMKKSAMLINIARGELVNQPDLIQALQDGDIQFAGLDVFEKEPLPKDNPLIDLDQTTLTCHSAFYGVEAQHNQISLAIELVTNALTKHVIPLKYIANKHVKSKISDLIITK